MSQPSAGRRRIAVWIAFVYFVAMAIFVTFPGIGPFNTIRPFILGIPFVFAWYLAWILGGLTVFVYLYRVFNE